MLQYFYTPWGGNGRGFALKEAFLSEITAITPQVKDKTRCNIFIDGRFYCGLTLEAAVKTD